MEALISIRNLSVDIREGKRLLNSVKDISFDIYPGEILGIVGESGSGKGHTALSIAGLLGTSGSPGSEASLGGNKEVTGGSILYDGKDLPTLTEKELQGIRGNDISMVFQEPFSSLNPLLKIGDQIAETLELHGEKNKASSKRGPGKSWKNWGFPIRQNSRKPIPTAFPAACASG